ncbi:flagellar hook-length control protein FliK [Noviherbaspirillum cavernae]|uniref:Flagellar hook-length control protein FliK n=1 Tax=Noviherbaspirillum cavernae TaxID=2320862 RepID=A0A418X7E6_9BURK|nr:flagellar hook-length control protein FliK [Noviherbaspirillum cavernae]
MAAQGKTKPATDDAEETEEAALAAASEELLALVANLNQPRAAAAETSTQTPASDDAAAAATAAAAAAAAAATTVIQAADEMPVSADAQAAQAAVAAQGAVIDTAPADAKQLAAALANAPRALGTKSAKTNPAAVTELKSSGKQQRPDASARAAAQTQAGFDAALAQGKEAKAAPEMNAGQTQAGLVEMTPSAQTSQAAQNAPEFHIPRTTTPDLQAVAAAVNGTAQSLVAQSPAALDQVQAASGQLPETLAPRVGTPGWDQALGQKVVWMVAGAQQSASLTLNPPDLGPLQVVLNVSNNQATASFTAAQPEVRQALESAMPKLREMLGDAGIQLGQASVSAGMPDHQQQAFGSQQQPSSRHSAQTNDDTDTPARVVRGQTIKGGQGLVDTFA